MDALTQSFGLCHPFKTRDVTDLFKKPVAIIKVLYNSLKVAMNLKWRHIPPLL